MNQFILTGKVLEKPLQQETNNGTKVAKIKLAVEKKGKDNESESETYEVVAFRTLAQEEYDVGNVIGVTGKMQANCNEKDGNIFYNCRLIANSITKF